MTCKDCPAGGKCMRCELADLGVAFKSDLGNMFLEAGLAGKDDVKRLFGKPADGGGTQYDRDTVNAVLAHLGDDCNNADCAVHKRKFEIEAAAYEMGFDTGAQVQAASQGAEQA